MPSLLTKTRSVMLDRAAFHDALGAVAAAIPSRTPKPILQSVYLKIDPEKGTELMATDLEVGIRHRVLGVKSDEPLDLVLPTRHLQSILSASRDKEVEITVEDETPGAVIRGARWRFTLSTEDPGLYPQVKDFEETNYHIIVAADFQKMIRRTIVACDAASTRYALGGTYFEATRTGVSLVGADGRRLAIQKAPAEIEGTGAAVSEGGGAVLPMKALKLVDRILGDASSEPPVHLAIVTQGGSSVPMGMVVRTERAVIHSPLVQGRFPRYVDAIPTDVKSTADVTVGELRGAVEQAVIATNGKESRGVDFVFGRDKGGE
ncbi:DNA polymerase III subunit beta, partial [Singulisphaera rosea]